MVEYYGPCKYTLNFFFPKIISSFMYANVILAVVAHFFVFFVSKIVPLA